MKYFTNFLNEGVIIPSIEFIEEEKNNIIKQVFKKNLSTKNLLSILNKIFNKYRIYFKISSKVSNKDYMYASIDEKFNITINVSNNFNELFNVDNLDDFNFNLESLKAIIGHELIHYYQISKMKKNEPVAKLIKKLEKITSYDDIKSYISNKLEPMAFAFQTITEFKNMGYTRDEILKRLQRPLDNSFEPYITDSIVFYTYVTNLSSKDPIYKKYFKFLYAYLDKIIPK